MTWSINVVGTKEGVKKNVEAAQAYGSDQSQIDAAKQLIAGEIDAMPESVQAVKVEASGHHDQTHSRNLRLQVEPITLALD